MKLVHPYTSLSDKWFRGNLHAHTHHSDGLRDRQAVIDDYAARGYHFLMISDHDIYTGPADYAKLDARGMVLIPGNEVSRGGVHLLHVNPDTHQAPLPDRQAVIDGINANPASFAVVNHPNWKVEFDHCPQESLLAWTGYKGIEIYNGVIGRLAGSPYALDRWDRMLSTGRRIWGYANDDSHRPEDVELGWNVVNVPELTVNSAVHALANGRFYCSTGVRISRIQVDGMTIRIETENADRIIASIESQKRIKTVDAKSIELEVPADAAYVRFECWGRGEQFAWTQPFFVES